MDNIGDVTKSNVLSDMVGIRCPLGECKVLQISDVSTYTVGEIRKAKSSDTLVLPLETFTSTIGIGAYEVPRLNYNIIKGSELAAGAKLSFNTTSDAFETVQSEVKVTAILLAGTTRAEQAVASEAIIHFNGLGFEDNVTGSDALTAV